MDFSRDWFFTLDSELRARGLDSDAQSFDEILENLKNRKIYSPDEFAAHCVYVILAGGFSQKTAKKIHEKIMLFLNQSGVDFYSLIKIFTLQNKGMQECILQQKREIFLLLQVHT